MSSEIHNKLTELLPDSPFSFISKWLLSLFVIPPPPSSSSSSQPSFSSSLTSSSYSSSSSSNLLLTTTVPFALCVWINVFQVLFVRVFRVWLPQKTLLDIYFSLFPSRPPRPNASLCNIHILRKRLPDVNLARSGGRCGGLLR